MDHIKDNEPRVCPIRMLGCMIGMGLAGQVDHHKPGVAAHYFSLDDELCIQEKCAWWAEYRHTKHECVFQALGWLSDMV